MITLLVAIGVSLQGCEFAVPKHMIGNWENKTSYLKEFEFLPQSGSTVKGILNSCSGDHGKELAGQCSGHGSCQEWFRSSVDGQPVARLSFCKCDLYWADPECRTQRQSQVVAYLLAIFFGMFGADQFYLGFFILGALKLVVLGTVAIILWVSPYGTEHHIGRVVAMAVAVVWYVFDVVKVGSTQLYTSESFRVAGDVSQAGFLLSVLGLAAFWGFAIGIHTIHHQRAYKSRELLLLLAESKAAEEIVGPGMYGSKAPPSFRGYGSTYA